MRAFESTALQLLANERHRGGTCRESTACLKKRIEALWCTVSQCASSMGLGLCVSAA